MTPATGGAGNRCVYVHQRFDIRMGQRGAMVDMIRSRWAPHLERRCRVRLAGVWVTAGSTGEWPELRVQWELDDWAHLAAASSRQHPMEERDTYLTELWNQALQLRRGGRSQLLRPTPFSPTLADVRSERIVGDVLICEDVRVRAGRMAQYHDALSSTGVPRAEARGVQLLGAYEHAIAPNVGLNLWVLPGWDEWRQLMVETGDRSTPAWNAGLDRWLADLDACVIVSPPTETIRT